MTSIIFMGTPEFSSKILNKLINHNYNITAIVTQPDHKVGRNHKIVFSPVKKLALKNNIPIFQPIKISDSTEMNQIINLHSDLIITAAFGQFLPLKLINSAKFGSINVHGSLLPKYRGGAPVQRAIMNGDSITGVSIIYMTNKMDAGDIISQQEIKITKQDDSGTILNKMSHIGSDMLINIIPQIVNKNVHSYSQNEQFVSFAHNISPEDEKLHLFQSASDIDFHIRGLRPYIGAYFPNFKGNRTQIWDIDVLDEITNYKPGTVVDVNKHNLKLAAARGTVYKINKIQPAGKSLMDITSYLNGIGRDINKGQVIIYE